MGMIKFENLPSTNTPLNAENLNHNFDLMHPVGSIHITSTNENPSSKFGGTWELIDKEFKELKATDENGTYFTINEAGATNYSLLFVRTGKTLSCKLTVTNAVELADGDVVFGTLNYEKLGISGVHFGLSGVLGSSDGGNGIFLFSIKWDTGVVTSSDVVSKISGETIAAGKTCIMQFYLSCDTRLMLDSACDKFYWKRTS